MSRRPKCLYSPGRTPYDAAQVCLWCEGTDKGRATMNVLESEGRNVRGGICPDCLTRHNADSLRGTGWELVGG
jgi:hypothetical protein